MHRFKQFARQILPPVLISWVKPFLPRQATDNTFTGNFSSWEEALKKAKGYDQSLILEKVKTAALLVRNGKAAYERDSVVFDKIDYSWPLLAELMRIAALNKNNLSVLDIGGSLGTTYRQNMSFLSVLDKLEWNVVEQPNFVRCGKDFFEDNALKFYFSIEECLKNKTVDVVIFSNSLQYIEKQEPMIREIINSKINYIILDKIPIHAGENNRILVQHVPEFIYEASYPVIFFNREKLISLFRGEFEMTTEFDCPAHYNSAILHLDASYKGFFFERKKKP